MQVQNLSSSDVTFSSFVSLHLLDRLNRQYDVTTVPGVKPSAPDGDIAAGHSLRGNVVFEVPTDTAGLKLRGQGSITSAGAVFALT